MTADEAFQTGLAHFQAGRLDEAEALYRAVLAKMPRQPDVLNALGAVLLQRGRFGEAAEAFGASVDILPVAERINNLGEALRLGGRVKEARGHYERALRLKPGLAMVWNNLGIAHVMLGEDAAAIKAFERALELAPDAAMTAGNLGMRYAETGDLARAQEMLRRAVELGPDLLQARVWLARVLGRMGRWNEAIAQYAAMEKRSPNDVEMHYEFGNLLAANGFAERGIGGLEKAARLAPGAAKVWHALGAAYLRVGHVPPAIGNLEHAVKLGAGHGAVSDLGLAQQIAGDIHSSVRILRQAMEMNPGDPVGHSNLLFTLLFDERITPAELFEEHLAWQRRHVPTVAGELRGHDNSKDPDRRLKIGYVSPGFSDHPVGRLIAPIVAAHDHGRFEVMLYSDVAIPDKLTDRLRSGADHWRQTAGMSDGALARMVRADGIDILIDLTLHLSGSRLMMFARKPAPVQISYLGYCATTGVAAMDYLITDHLLHPEPGGDPYHVEKLLYLPGCYWTYAAPDHAPEVALPADAGGGVTFASFNNICKINGPVMEAWAGILRRVPRSRILFVIYGGDQMAARVQGAFGRLGIEAGRIVVRDRQGIDEYHGLFNLVDIALDPFPYNGGTTTLDGLYMGVPAITLAGKTPMGRAGVTLLTHAGLPELIAGTVEEYIQKGVDLAENLPRLRGIRRGLRGQMRASVIMDSAGFTRGLEQAYQRAWGAWCAEGAAARGSQ